jgi:hypothetical protein
MTKHEGPMQVGVNSAGCSVESSPVDSLLDDQGESCILKRLSPKLDIAISFTLGTQGINPCRSLGGSFSRRSETFFASRHKTFPLALRNG